MSPQFTCLVYSVGEYSLMLDERDLGTEKCHGMSFGQWLQGIQLVLNLTNILWCSLGLFMVLWAKLVNEEHIMRGARTGRQHKVLRKPVLKSVPHTGSAVMLSIAGELELLAALFPVLTFFLLTSLLSARQQKELTVVPLVYIRPCRLEQLPTSCDLT